MSGGEEKAKKKQNEADSNDEDDVPIFSVYRTRVATTSPHPQAKLDAALEDLSRSIRKHPVLP